MTEEEISRLFSELGKKSGQKQLEKYGKEGLASRFRATGKKGGRPKKSRPLDSDNSNG